MTVRAIRCLSSAAALVAGSLLSAPAAYADETVTYEVFSAFIPVADIEYMDQAGERTFSPSVPLPWRMDVQMEDAEGPTGQGAQLRADWRRIRGPARWLTVRISQGGQILCESVLDVGNASCYGNVSHFS